ncbi:glycerol kinase GlpK [cyanobiont of Ornithocercus magnificus]|nr:glycerol kinase GlpK [cyanobiont of Ornithocercus magnificus]
MTESPLILALDQGTSSSRAMLFDTSGNLVASAFAPLAINYPADGWVEQNASDIWHSQCQAMAELERKIKPEQRQAVVSCGITNQRETTVLWRRSSGELCGPAIVWQDRRTTDLCLNWKHQGFESEWRRRTGLLLDPYFSASKIKWLLEHEVAASSAANDHDLCFGTVESWLLWQLSAGKHHYSDMSNASRTLLMDLEKCCWVDSFCNLTGLSLDALPELVPCRGNFGRIAAGLPFAGVPVQALLGDQQAATFGQLCLNYAESKCTYGTGAFLVVNTGSVPCYSQEGLLSTLGWTNDRGKPTYCLEGSLFNAGTVVQWLKDGLGIISCSEEVDALASTVNDAAGLMFVPAFTGWGTPYWDPMARGLLIGLTRDSCRGHIARAALEGIALSVAKLVGLAEGALGQGLGELAVDGGAAASDKLLQAQADCTGLQVQRRLACIQSSARGAALLAGVQCGAINLPTLVASRRNGAQFFLPRLSAQARQNWLSRWDNAVHRSLYWHV